MKPVSLTAHPRSQVQRAEVTKLRAAGRVPATIYGRLGQPQNLEIVLDDINALLNHSVSENLVVDLNVAKDARAQRLALVQEVQHHPLTGRVIHIDFHEVAADEKVTVSVPVETTGEAVGVKNGGSLEHVLHKVKVRCFAKDLPEQIVIDVTALEIGKAIHIGEVVPPSGVELLGDKHLTLVSVAAPRAEEVVAATDATKAAGEVEMTKEKKEDGTAAPAGKGDAKAGDKKADAKPEAKADAKKK